MILNKELIGVYHFLLQYPYVNIFVGRCMCQIQGLETRKRHMKFFGTLENPKDV